jgi:flagellar biosynthesis/type III secretory pathway protein FliH
MRAAMDLLREVRDRLDADAIRTATDIGLAVAEELAGGAIAAEPARVLAIVDEAARRMDPDAPIRIRVAPAMLERLSALEGLDEGRIWRGMALVPDENMEPSGCVVETDFQRVDARIRSRISKLRHLLGVEMGFTP